MKQAMPKESCFSPTAPPSSGTAEEAPRNVLIKPQVEFPEQIVETEAPEDVLGFPPLPELTGTKPIIHRSLFVVSQYSIRLIYLLEHLLGFFVVRVSIRMILEREPPIGPLNLILGGITMQSQSAIVVLSIHTSLPMQPPEKSVPSIL